MAKYIPDQVKSVTPTTVIDYYLPENNCKHPHTRLRVKGNKYEITKKQPLNGIDSSEQSEHTITLTKQEFDDLSKGRTRVVIKDRYCVEIDGHQADVDIFKGDLAGLVLIDFEFNSVKDKDNFIPPEICLEDVTQEEFIAGGILAGKSYADIKDKLKKYKYKKLKHISNPASSI